MKASKKALLAAVSAAFVMSAPAHAFTFNAGGEVINDVQSFDWTVSNALAVGSGGAQVGETFQLLSHGSLGNFLDSNGQAITPTGLNTGYEITYTTSFQEQVFGSNLVFNPVTGEAVGTQQFVTTGEGTNFFEMWYHDTINANMLAGTGFNDGILIASGTIQLGGIGNFSASFASSGNPECGLLNPVACISLDPTAYGDLDEFGGNDYTDIKSVSGSGGSEFNVVVEFGSYNTDFFVNGIGPLAIAFNTSQILPFQETNPSALFAGAAGGAAPAEPGATLASVGPINGLTGPNVILQVDANSSLTLRQVPEPASLALVGLGLLGLGFASRRRRTSTAL